MGGIRLYGAVIGYTYSDFGILTEGSEGNKRYFEYSSFDPALMELSSRTMSKEAFLKSVRAMVARTEEPSSWKSVRCTTGTGPKPNEEKRKALENTKNLLKSVLASLDGKK